MKGRFASLLLCCALVACVGTAAFGLTLEIPADFLAWARSAADTAPQLQRAERDLAAARSRYRSDTAAAAGSTLLLAAPLQVNGEAAGAGVQLSLRNKLGGTVTTASVGVAQAYEWDGSAAVVPTLAVRVTHPLGQGPETQAVRSALELAAAEAAYRDAVGAWQVAMLSAYAQLQAAVKDRQTAADQLELSLLHLAAAQAREREGAAAPAEVYTARLAVTKAESELLKADLAVEKARTELERLAGKAWDGGLLGAEAPVVEILLHPEAPDAGAAEAWVELALAHRPDLRLAAERVRLAELELAKARRAAGLTGSLEGGLTFPESATAGTPELGWYVRATWTLPLRDAGLAEAVVRAQLNLEQALADRSELEQRVRTDVQIALRELQLAEEVLARLDQELVHARQMLDLAIAAWQDGVGTELDVYNARIGLARAERAALDARYDVLLKRAALWRTVGGEVLW